MSNSHYSKFEELQHLAKRYNAHFSAIDSSMLTRQGKLTRDMWKAVNDAFSEAINLEDALTRLSFTLDELVEKMDYSIYDHSYLRDSIKNIRLWVRVHIDHSIWEDYPLIANPFAA